MPEQVSDNIKALKILHSALVACVILFAAIVFFLVYNNYIMPVKELDKPFQVIAIIFCIAGMYFSNIFFNKLIEPIRNSTDDILKKMNGYRAASIIKWVLLEGPALFSVTAFFLTGNYAFLVLAGIMICALYIAMPSRQKIITQLQLDEMEAEQF